MATARFLVSGRVQGVFFRASTRNEAERLGLAGSARNLDDGRVEVLACGEAAAVEAFIAWLWKGSAASKVTAVETQELDPASVQCPADFASA